MSHFYFCCNILLSQQYFFPNYTGSTSTLENHLNKQYFFWKMFSNMQQVFEWGGLFLTLLFLLNNFLFNLKEWGGYSPPAPPSAWFLRSTITVFRHWWLIILQYYIHWLVAWSIFPPIKPSLINLWTVKFFFSKPPVYFIVHMAHPLTKTVSVACVRGVSL